MHKYFISSLICLCILACKNTDTEKDKFPMKLAKVDVENIITKINNSPINIKIDLSSIIEGNFNDYFSLKNIIFLDSKSPIGQISLIRQDGNKIFILDRENTQSLFCFNLKGELLWEFKSKGRGPLEYLKISDFIINKTTNTIDVLDKQKYKIINVDINTGVAKKSFDLGFYGREMVLYGDGYYLIHTENLTVSEDLNYKLLLVNLNQEVSSRSLPVASYEKDKHWTGFRSLEKFNETIYFTETINDTIYTIKNDTLKTAYFIDFMDKKFPEELKTNFTFNKVEKLQREKAYISTIDLIREKNGVLNFMFSYKNFYYTVFYDIEKRTSFIFNKLKNGKIYGEYEQILTQGYVDDGFIKIVDPYMFEVLKKQMKSNKKIEENLINEKPEFYEVLKNSNEDSNPILFVYEFKKNN